MSAKTLVLAMMFALLSIGPAYAEEDKHPIDAWYAAAMSKAQSTADMLNVEGDAYERWDKELNVVYQRLLRKLDPAAQKSLRESQRSWLALRGSEFKFQEDLWRSAVGDNAGTADTLAWASSRTLFVRERVLALISDEEILATPP